MSKILLIRHGQASFMKANYDQLSDLGREQSIKLGHWMKDRDIQPELVWSGTLSRQQDTCRLSLGEERLPTIDTSFNEHEGPSVFKDYFPTFLSDKPELSDLIKLKGVQDAEVRPQLIKSFFQMHHLWTQGRIESGEYESWEDFKSRARVAYDLILASAKDGTVAVYTSGGLIASILGLVLDLKDDKVVDINWQIRNTSITELKLSSGRLLLREFNATPHLPVHEVTYV
jgi:broad specificity phosphatase PhoE